MGKKKEVKVAEEFSFENFDALGDVLDEEISNLQGDSDDLAVIDFVDFDNADEELGGVDALAEFMLSDEELEEDTDEEDGTEEEDYIDEDGTDEEDTDEEDTDEEDTDEEDGTEEEADTDEEDGTEEEADEDGTDEGMYSDVDLDEITGAEETGQGNVSDVDVSAVMSKLKNGVKGISKSYEMVQPNQIVLSAIKKSCRQETLQGLTESVKVWGVCTPLHVMKVSDNSYVLLDGLRRLYASLRVNPKQEIPCIVWDFEDNQIGQVLQNVIGFMINKSTSFTPQELWAGIEYLETNNNLKPTELEYLLNMVSGDAMKLKDLMLSEGYDDIMEKLLAQELTISAAYDKLCKQRKKEEKERLKREDAKAVKPTESGEIEENDFMTAEQSDEDVRKDLGMPVPDEADVVEVEDENGDVHEVEDLGAVVGGPAEKQKVGERHIIDPLIKQRTLRRDDFTCQCCGVGGEAFIGVLVYHHKVPVYCGGEDSVDNGVTLCTSCHCTLHLYEQGKLPHLKELLADYDEANQQRIRKIAEYGNIALKAAKKKNISKEKIKEMAAEGTKHMYPDAVIKDNMTAYKEYQKEKPEEDADEDEVTED